MCTHPDEDHFGGIEILDAAMPISNFYVVRNQATKDINTPSFSKYKELRDGPKAYYLYKGCSRKWLNESGDGRDQAGIAVLWPDLSNGLFREALETCDAGGAYNNTSAVFRYSLQGGANFLWLGDLETEFMENIFPSMNSTKRRSYSRHIMVATAAKSQTPGLRSWTPNTSC
jgi:hypothetical protein